MLESLGKIQCTTKEAAAVLDVSEPTFIEFLKRHEKARYVYEKGKDSGRASLRRMQFKAAERGNVTMQIWLGKQLLDQKDATNRLEVGKPGDFANMTDDELDRFIVDKASGFVEDKRTLN